MVTPAMRVKAIRQILKVCNDAVSAHVLGVAPKEKAYELIEAGGMIYGEMLNLAVWVKSNAGQGSFYRSQHELIGIFRVGQDAHLNNVELGRHGRSRSNVWHYAGINTFRAGRMDELQSHPTVKPVALVADAMRDCSRRGDIVLDFFGGSGTTLLAAERVGRRAYMLEIEPRFVDVAIKRWQTFSGKDGICAETGLSFDEIASTRVVPSAAGSAPAHVREREASDQSERFRDLPSG